MKKYVAIFLILICGSISASQVIVVKDHKGKIIQREYISKDKKIIKDNKGRIIEVWHYNNNRITVKDGKGKIIRIISEN